MKILDDVAEGIVKTEKELHEFGEQRRKERWYCYNIFLLISQIMMTVFLVVIKTLNSSSVSSVFISAYAAIAPSSVITLVAFTDFTFLYKRLKYRYSSNSFWKHIIVQLVVATILVVLFGINEILDLIYKFCDLPYVRLVFSIIAAIHIVVPSVYLLCASSSKNRKYVKKEKAKAAEQTEDEEDQDAIRKKLARSISGNAIKICLLKNQWGFSAGEELQFGFDNKNGCFVFVNRGNSHIIDYKKLVFLDYEDVVLDKTNGTLGMIGGALIGAHYHGLLGAVLFGAEGRVASQTRKIDRLIKLYVMNPGNKESIIACAQVFSQEYIYGDGGIEKLKEIADSIQNESAEIVFRRKIRHKASELDKENYPSRPFVDDEWFKDLKNNMEQAKNSRTDGYTLFRKQVIEEEEYLNDMDIQHVIQCLSSETPDVSSLRREAKRLCHQDSIVAMGENIKSGIKNMFSRK